MTSNTPHTPNSSSSPSGSTPPSEPDRSTYSLSGEQIAGDRLSSEQPQLPDGPIEDLDGINPNYLKPDLDPNLDPDNAPWMTPESSMKPDMEPEPRAEDTSGRSRFRSSHTQEFIEPESPPISRPNPAFNKKKRNGKVSFEYAQEDINALRNALTDNNVFRLSFYFLDYILRAQTALFEQIHRQQQLPRIIASMSILCAILSSIYGLTMGMDHSILQSLAAAIKLPILFVLTAVICIPSLYTFNVLLGQRFKFLQTVTLMVMTLGTTSILLASLAPIAFFFSLTTPQYSFLLLLHVSIFGLCGIYGVQYLYRGCSYLAFRMEQPLNNLLLRIWIVIYGLVGMQLGWRLRPFVGSDGSPFQIFRSEQGGNFYIAVWSAFSALFGGG